MKVKVDDNLYISDNTQDHNENTLILKTSLNEKYLKDKTYTTIDTKELKRFLGHENIKIIGITGTNGKSSTVFALAHILKNLNFKVAVQGTEGFFIDGEVIKSKGLTSPDVLECYYNLHKAKEEGVQFFIMEVSSHAIAQNRIEGIEFTLKAITNIKSDHLDFHKTLEEYIKTKNSFLQDGSLKVVNIDDKM